MHENIITLNFTNTITIGVMLAVLGVGIAFISHLAKSRGGPMKMAA